MPNHIFSRKLWSSKTVGIVKIGWENKIMAFTLVGTVKKAKAKNSITLTGNSNSEKKKKHW